MGKREGRQERQTDRERERERERVYIPTLKSGTTAVACLLAKYNCIIKGSMLTIPSEKAQQVIEDT